jgi:hypothetical protein
MSIQWWLDLLRDSIRMYGGWGEVMSAEDACPYNDGVIIP